MFEEQGGGQGSFFKEVFRVPKAIIFRWFRTKLEGLPLWLLQL